MQKLRGIFTYGPAERFSKMQGAFLLHVMGNLKVSRRTGSQQKVSRVGIGTTSFWARFVFGMQKGLEFMSIWSMIKQHWITSSTNGSSVGTSPLDPDLCPKFLILCNTVGREVPKLGIVHPSTASGVTSVSYTATHQRSSPFFIWIHTKDLSLLQNQRALFLPKHFSGFI